MVRVGDLESMSLDDSQARSQCPYLRPNGYETPFDPSQARTGLRVMTPAGIGRLSVASCEKTWWVKYPCGTWRRVALSSCRLLPSERASMTSATSSDISPPHTPRTSSSAHPPPSSGWVEVTAVRKPPRPASPPQGEAGVPRHQPRPTPTRSPDEFMKHLAQLVEWRDQGKLTAEQYDAAKRMIGL
eukprot:Sspe_Gene.72601::Locus_43412_Transcript_1_1_Confidence_1.000_Length_799::g.72601::m.72601